MSNHKCCQNSDKIAPNSATNADVRALVEELELAGFELSDGGSVLLIRPASELSPDQIGRVKVHRDGILAMIRAEADHRIQDRHVLYLMWSGAMDDKRLSGTIGGQRVH